MAETNYRQEAEEAAWETAYQYVDNMVEHRIETGKISDDLYNDYPGGDSWHHESHVDRDYDLQEAAELLQQLREHEETDYGLWQGCEPRRAIAVQAAFTYGNAVMSEWHDLVEELNEFLDDNEDSESDSVNEALAECYIRLMVKFHNYSPGDHPEKEAFLRAILADLPRGDFSSALVYMDWLEENGDQYDTSTMKEVRELVGKYENALKEAEAEEDVA